MNVPLLNLPRQYKTIKKDIDKAIKNVLEKQNFVLGEDVHKLEEEVAKYCGTKYAVSCASGTDALILALRAIDVKPGDEVITTSYSFIATSEAIHRVGAKPVFCDISTEDFNMDIDKIEKLITKKTKAILPVHLYGQSVDMARLNRVAKKHNLKVLEDACQAMGAKYKNKMVGNLGDVAAFSFFPTKNLGGFGDGGILTTNDKKIYEAALLLRTHGMGKQYLHVEHGYNSRLDTLQAAVLRVKLKHLDKWMKQRRANAKVFNKGFENIPVITPKEMKNCYHTYHQYTLITENRDDLFKYLNGKGIAARIYYPVALHQQPCYSNLKKAKLPVVENVQKKVLSLPVYGELNKKELKYIVDTVQNFF